MEFLLSHKNNEIMPLAATSTWMDLEIIIVSEVSQTKKEKYHTLSLIIWKLKKKKKIQMNLQTERDSQT